MQRFLQRDVGIATVAQHRDKRECEHAIVIGPAFPTSEGDTSALGTQIKADRQKSRAVGSGQDHNPHNCGRPRPARSSSARQTDRSSEAP